MMDRRHFLAGAGGVALAATAQGASAKRAATPRADRPKKFLFGAATAAHQIEGNNINNDYWVLENIPSSGFTDRSADACDSWNRWQEDLALVKQAGLDSYRFSIEWARIEPEKDQFSPAILDYYRRICATAREMGINPIVTFHHFTSPRWIAAMGGWENPETVDRYARYCERATRALGDLLDYGCTINEPNAQVNSYIVAGMKAWDGEAKVQAEAARAVGSDRFSAFFQGNSLKVRDICIAAHHKGRDAIKGVAPHMKVGITLALQDLRPGKGGEALYKSLWNEARLPFYEAAQKDDFIGVQSYNRLVTAAKGYAPPKPGAYLDSWKQESPPDVIAFTVREAYREAKVPVFVTEHGINVIDDAERVRHLGPSLEALAGVVDEGVPVLGYTHWSLLDNYEWSSGYKPRFGLYAVDRTTFKRTAKPSAAVYAKLIQDMRGRFEKA